MWGGPQTSFPSTATSVSDCTTPTREPASGFGDGGGSRHGSFAYVFPPRPLSWTPDVGLPNCEFGALWSPSVGAICRPSVGPSPSSPSGLIALAVDAIPAPTANVTTAAHTATRRHLSRFVTAPLPRPPAAGLPRTAKYTTG